MKLLLASIVSGFALFLTACNAANVEPVAATNAQKEGSPFFLLSAQLQKEMTACTVEQAEFDRLLALSQKGFDQNFSGEGWRPLADKEGCKNTAGEVIKAYILYSTPAIPENQNILRWHAGQMKAGAGKYNEALAFFRGTYYRDSDTRNGEWNLYVDATIAFLSGDREALVQARDKLAAMPVSEKLKTARRKFLKDNPNITMPDEFVDEPQNLTPVNNLLTCFGQPYAKAYGKCEVGEAD